MYMFKGQLVQWFVAVFKIMKDMERWAKIQNRQKESVRAPSPVLKTGIDDDKRQSKSADAGFAIFERKVGDRLPASIHLCIFTLSLRYRYY